ncbi:MAG: TolC family protein [Candidatus Sumerlaeia bacterium]|nr:TolC family protein [Candidatus Sumerlaeia bacterium]
MNRKLSVAPCIRGCLSGGVVLALSVLSGCAAYKAAPLDPESLSSRWQDRRASVDSRLAQNDTISLRYDELERIALLLNPELNLARLEAGVAVASAQEAGRWTDPVLSLDALRILDPEVGQNPRLYGAGLSFTLPLSGRLAAEKSGANARKTAALTNVWKREQLFKQELKLSANQLTSELEKVTILTRHVEELRAIRRVSQQLVEAGELLSGDGALFESAFVDAELALQVQHTHVETQRLRLASLTGLSPQIQLDVVEEPAGEFIAMADGIGNFNQLALRNPEALQAEAEYNVAEENLRLAIREQYPDLELGPLFEREDGQDRLGHGVSVPLPLWNGNRREIAERKAEREASRSAWENSILQAESRLFGLRVEHAAAISQYHLVSQQLVPASEARYSKTRELITAGELNSLLLMESLSARRDAALQLTDVRYLIQALDAEFKYLFPSEPHLQPATQKELTP